jgi:hypothetical protein
MAEIPTIREILKLQIASLGGNGLCFPFMECGCGLDEIAPCGCLDIDGCKVAKKGEDGYYYVMEEK